MHVSPSRHEHFPRADPARRTAIRAAVSELDAAWTTPDGQLAAIDAQADASPDEAIAALLPWLTDTLTEVTATLDHHGVDLTDEASIHRCPTLLAGLQRNRTSSPTTSLPRSNPTPPSHSPRTAIRRRSWMETMSLMCPRPLLFRLE